MKSYLILVNFSILQFSFALFLKGNDDEGHKNVDKEKRENNEENNVENGHFDSEQRDGSFVFVGGCHRVLKDSENDDDYYFLIHFFSLENLYYAGQPSVVCTANRVNIAMATLS